MTAHAFIIIFIAMSSLIERVWQLVGSPSVRGSKHSISRLTKNKGLILVPMSILLLTRGPLAKKGMELAGLYTLPWQEVLAMEETR